jgi:N-acetylneuraminate synthase
MKGNGIKRPAESEKNSRLNTRKSIVLLKNLKKGETIKRDSIAVKRPGYGIQPKFIEHVIGRTVKKDMEKEDILKWDDF